MSEIHRLSHARTNDKILRLVAAAGLRGRRVLDVGAGEGYFARLLGEHARRAHGVTPAEVVRACDRYPAQFRYADVACDPIAADGALPYPAASFDAACSIEVVEHVEDQFRFVRELHRVLKPGGRAFVSTPNLLNVNSRLRYLRSGFWLLFDPLPLATADAVHTAGHIHPITFYYLAYAFHRAGFREVRVHFDRRKASGVAWAILLAPLVWLGRATLRARLRRKAPQVYGENAALLARHNGWDMLTSRSIIVEGVK